ncbi:MAG: hypothetical protein IT222_06460 [Crocinitomix sp.]|nr:hypothetical protein [Crocinitomix sp.]
MQKQLLLLLLIVCQFASAQKSDLIGISFGLRSHFGGNQAFSDVLNYYNEKRPWLDNGFATNTNLNGFELGFEINQPKVGLSFLRIYRVATTRTAKGTENTGTAFTRSVKYRIHGLELFDFWWTPLHLGNFNLGFGAMPLATGTARFKTIYNDVKTKIDLSDLERNGDEFIFRTRHYYANLHLDVTRLNESKTSAFHLQFFYTLGPKQEYDLYYLNQQINPYTYQGINKRTLLKMDNFGVKLFYNL